MSDIVERLRQGIERGDEGDAEAAMDKAADEIERLRAALREIADSERLHGLPPPTGPLATTLKMLRARRAHLDMLIALIEMERDLFQGASHER